MSQIPVGLYMETMCASGRTVQNVPETQGLMPLIFNRKCRDDDNEGFN